jgi:hypothetical protein
MVFSSGVGLVRVKKSRQNISPAPRGRSQFPAYSRFLADGSSD